MKLLTEIFYSKEEIELSKMIENSLINESDKWSIGEYNAIYGDIDIWISNSPYADMKLNGRRLCNRSKLRLALHKCKINKAKSVFNK